MWGLGEASEKAFPQDAQFFPPAERHSRGENVILLQGDLFEQAAVNVDQDPKRRLTVFGYVCDQLVPGGVELARPVGFERQHGTKTGRSEEHTSELQSHVNLVCRLLLEKKK